MEFLCFNYKNKKKELVNKTCFGEKPAASIFFQTDSSPPYKMDKPHPCCICVRTARVQHV